MLKTVTDIFEDFAIFIPDQISSFTLKALGYEQSRINLKVKKQDNYLKNKVKKALIGIADHDRLKPSNKIITLSSIMDNVNYLQSYDLVMHMFNSNKLFKSGCTQTSNWILSNHRNYNELTINNSLLIAVQYFLKELPIFLCAPEILNVKSCCFIYPTIPKFLQEIYDNYNIASKNQGFATIM